MLPPFFDASLILHEDADLVVVNKPSGMSSQSADPDHPDDVVFRLTRFLRERDGSAPKLGVHQRLDRDTSGVIVFAKTERANRSLSRQFEARTVRKEYVACVRGFRGGARTLEHALGELEHGRVQVLRTGDPRGSPAICDVAPIERNGERALVGITLHTGRTHQIRVQLATEESPVAGDGLYGSDPAHRLMLHASLLGIERPLDGNPLVVRAKIPATFKRWLGGEDAVPLTDPKAVRAALERALRVRAGLHEARADDRAIDAYRLLHAEADGVQHLVVDVYGDHLVAQLYETLTPEAESALLDAIHTLGFAGVYLKRRPTNASRVVDPTREEVAPHEVLRGESVTNPLRIREHGVPYDVRLDEGLSTGIFLDQRDNRRRVREVAQGARVLNLFAYTCGFSCAAAHGGAREVVSVDASGPALARGEANFALGGYAAAHRVIRGDVFEVLDAAREKGERFDLVVCDPPTYSTTKHGRWTSGADWTRLAEAVLHVTSARGTVFFSSNDRRMNEKAFRQRIQAAVTLIGGKAQVRSFDAPSDHPRVPGSESTMKTVRVKLGS